ncbi:putative nacht and ankyrin domain protein [Mycena sanguinolenta]|uniref:Putative nacht and ankyrin domain protein n=1 Tax=Mycena sanguinolenta TaxID=230812 RepID=A0A8H7DJY8_9AGAR|nr:putative nacht and ankyrin domain protein [Mycena sanguinolenta]
MDPLSITSGVAGVISLAVQVAQTVSTLISDIKDAPVDVKDLESDIKSLAALLATTQSLYDAHGKNLVQDAATFDITLNICLERCVGPLKELEELLKPFGAASTKKRNLLRVMNSLSWVMKKGVIKGLKDRLKDAKASLTLTVSVLNGYISGRGQEQIQRDIIAGYDKLQQDFLNLERGTDWKRRLALDVASVRGTEDSQSLSEYTDTGLPLRRFFASAHQWNSGSSNLEPPMESIASESMDDDTSEFSVETPTPLVSAVLSGDQAAVDRRLKSGSSILERSPDGLSLLHLCVVTNNHIMATYILDQDTEHTLLNCKDASRRTPFMLAVEERSIEVASLLVERGCSLGDFMSITMDLLESGEEGEDIRKLLKPVAKRMKGSSRGPYPLHRAVRTGNHDLLTLLLGAGFDPDAKDEKGIQAIFYAVSIRNTKAIAQLAHSGANLNVYLPPARRSDIGVEEARECTPLVLAGHVVQDHAITRLLLDFGARADFICPNYSEHSPN